MICAGCGLPSEIPSERLCEACREASESAPPEREAVGYRVVPQCHEGPGGTIFSIGINAHFDADGKQKLLEAIREAFTKGAGLFKIPEMPDDTNNGRLRS